MRFQQLMLLILVMSVLTACLPESSSSIWIIDPDALPASVDIKVHANRVRVLYGDFKTDCAFAAEIPVSSVNEQGRWSISKLQGLNGARLLHNHQSEESDSLLYIRNNQFYVCSTSQSITEINFAGNRSIKSIDSPAQVNYYDSLLHKDTIIVTYWDDAAHQLKLAEITLNKSTIEQIKHRILLTSAHSSFGYLNIAMSATEDTLWVVFEEPTRDGENVKLLSLELDNPLESDIVISSLCKDSRRVSGLVNLADSLVVSTISAGGDLMIHQIPTNDHRRGTVAKGLRLDYLKIKGYVDITADQDRLYIVYSDPAKNDVKLGIVDKENCLELEQWSVNSFLEIQSVRGFTRPRLVVLPDKVCAVYIDGFAESGSIVNFIYQIID